DGGVRQELAAGIAVEATSILPSLNGKTARLWRAIVPSTHLAREGRMTVTIGRRELLAALGGAAAVWPLAARAEQAERLRKVGVLVPAAAGTPHWQAYVAAFREGLQKLGWSDGRNIHIEERWGPNADELGSHAAEFAGMMPDVILAGAASASRPI